MIASRLVTGCLICLLLPIVWHASLWCFAAFAVVGLLMYDVLLLLLFGLRCRGWWWLIVSCGLMVVVLLL